VQDTLQRLLDIVLQADPKTILPPYLELDRNDKSVTDISGAFPVSSVDSYHALKKYFFRLSPRDEEGISWCSVILAQALPFPIFMDKAKYSLENNDFSIWPKASDNENTTDAGWLLHSTRAQDEDRISALLCELTGENVGVKWKPIRASSSNIRRKDQAAPEEKKGLARGVHVDRLQDVRDKLAQWYSSDSKKFPDGTKMRLVPTITAVAFMENKIKFALCLARQAALNAGLASAVTREISTNLLLDRVDHSTSISFRQVLMGISPQDKPGTTLFHTIDRQFKSDIIVNFQFHPDLIAGLVPYLKDNGHEFHLKMFTPEAIQRQARARWNSETREADSENDTELANLLAKDDNLNFTDEPTLKKVKNKWQRQKQIQLSQFTSHQFQLNISPPCARMTTIYPPFIQEKPINLADESDTDEEKEDAPEDSTFKTRKTTTSSPVGILRTPRIQEDAISKISFSDSATRISSLETELSTMNKKFHEEKGKLQDRALQQAKEQLLHGSLLTEILTLLKGSNISSLENSTNPTPSTTANQQVTVDAGGSQGAAGHG
jgi:hypothetical protein